MSPNMYVHLDNLDDDVVKYSGTNNERRKAEKKLKEIQTLLKKTSHTKEELDKLATEQHWKDIIDWIDHPKKTAEKTEETPKMIKNRLKRKREKEKRERELEEILKRREKEAEEQKRRQEEILKQRRQREKEAEEQKRRHQEDRKQKRQEEEEFRKQQQKREEEEEFRKHHREHQDLWSEFEALYRQNNNVNKTFRKLSVKYHPDKNIGKKQSSEAKQKELTNIRDYYSSKYSIE